MRRKERKKGKKKELRKIFVGREAKYQKVFFIPPVDSLQIRLVHRHFYLTKQKKFFIVEIGLFLSLAKGKRSVVVLAINLQ